MTLEDYLINIGESADGQFQCESCRCWNRAFALKHTSGRKGTCASCVIDEDREPSVEPGTSKANWDDVRAYRANLMVRTDWTQLADVSLTVRLQYQAHRAALRDVTAKHSTPEAAMAWLRSVENFKP